MLIPWQNPSIRLTGRWDKRSRDKTITTNPGSYIEIAFQGPSAYLLFDVEGNMQNRPHLWISLDGGPKVEVTVEPVIRIQAGSGPHRLLTVFKSAVEPQARWFSPLVGKVAFKGADVSEPAFLEPDNRPLIEFVGDSITEGVLIDVDYTELSMENRVYHDDSTATYAWLTAASLGLRPRITGFGGVGVTKGGQGSVPRAALSYPYVFDGCPLDNGEDCGNPKYILINHGANDRGSTSSAYVTCYLELLEVIRRHNPSARIFALSAFVGAFQTELEAGVSAFNRENKDSVTFISSAGWAPKDPLHPLRDGHEAIAAKLVEVLLPLLG